ncbi:MAG: Gfo/Idh/MocA family oxidoreductase [Pyrinomonadaceae bacterium]
MINKIRIGIIGTGFARKTQIPSFLALDDVEIISVASASRVNAESTAQEFGISHFTDNWRETVERDDIDLISIVTPPVFHREMTLAAIKHGKHVLCEKPMAMNAEEAREMTQKAAVKGVLALINHELRFLNGRRRAFEIIRSGGIGKIMHCKILFRNASRGTQEVTWNWWSDSSQGGGALGAIGSHAVDTFRWLTGAEIAEVFCSLKINIKERLDKNSNRMRRVTSDDEANLILRLTDSEFALDTSATVSLSVVEAGKYEHRVEIFGTKGALAIEEGGELWQSKMSDHDWQRIEIDLGTAAPNVQPGGWSRGFINFAGEIIAALREGKNAVENAATFEDGLKTQIVLDAARKSAANRSSIKIEPV